MNRKQPSTAELIEQLRATGLMAEAGRDGDVAVATKAGNFLGAFPPDTPVRAVIVAAAAFDKGFRAGTRKAGR